MSTKSVKETIIDELYKPARINYPRRHVMQRGIKDTFQIDLVDMIKFKSDNNGHQYILMCIDIFSKYLYARPLHKKSAKEVTEAMETIIQESKHPPKNIHSDQGKEFLNSLFKKLMEKYNINFYYTHSEMKASIVERVNRTIKTKLVKGFDLNNSFNWTNILPSIIKQYNNTKHRTISMAPKNVNKSNERMLLNTVYVKYNTIVYKKPKFLLGECVRISKIKGLFEKGYEPSWGPHIFEIVQIKNTSPRTYILKDTETNNVLRGGFLELELQHVKYRDAYLVHRILKRRGRKVLVSWKGYPESKNSWIEAKDLL